MNTNTGDHDEQKDIGKLDPHVQELLDQYAKIAQEQEEKFQKFMERAKIVSDEMDTNEKKFAVWRESTIEKIRLLDEHQKQQDAKNKALLDKLFQKPAQTQTPTPLLKSCFRGVMYVPNQHRCQHRHQHRNVSRLEHIIMALIMLVIVTIMTK